MNKKEQLIVEDLWARIEDAPPIVQRTQWFKSFKRQVHKQVKSTNKSTN